MMDLTLVRPGETVDQLLDRTEQELIRRLDELREERSRRSGTLTARSHWTTFDSILKLRSQHNDVYSTGFPTLDLKLEGGIYPGSLLVFQGKPGAGKTLLATQIALALARRCAVGALYADEGMQGAVIRIAQQLGFSRREIMAGNSAIVAEASAAFAAATSCWKFLNPSSPDGTIETLVEGFEELAPPGQRVWLIDSAQVVRSRKRNGRMDRRQAVSELLGTLRELTIKHQAIALVISQISRGSYRSKKEEDRDDPLAAGLESSAIEFMADLILHLDGDPKKITHLRCPKNRISAEGTFTLPLTLDFPRARFLEAEIPEEDEKESIAAQEAESAAKKVAEKLVAKLKRHPEGLMVREILQAICARKATVYMALEILERDFVVFSQKKEGKGGGLLWKLGTNQGATGETK